MPYEAQATKEEIKERNRKCWWTGCNKSARFEDWTGYRHCFYHTWYVWKNSENKWFNLKTLKIIY